MPVTGIGPVKAALLALDAQKLNSLLTPLITVDSRLPSVRDHVLEFCKEEGIPV